MRFPPVAERELRVASRRPRTYRNRLVGALVAIVLCGYTFWVMAHTGGLNSAGRHVFEILTRLALLYCLFGGVTSTADCLSREKREGTMGLLFLTDLRSSQILAGKLTSNSLGVIHGIIAAVPIFAICLVMGGIEAGEFWRAVLALFNALFFALSVGLLVSSACREERRATQTASGIIILFAFVFPALGEYLRVKTSAIDLGLLLKTLSPGETIDLISLPTAGARQYWRSLFAIHLLGWFCFDLACLVLPRSWQDRPLREKVPWGRRWLGDFLNARARRLARRPLLDQNPFYWLADRSTIGLETWILFGIAVLAALWAGWFFRRTFPAFLVCLTLAIVVHSVGKMQICWAACDQLAREKQHGTLEMLLATPLSPSEILRGQWMALFRQFTGLMIGVLVLDLVMLGLVLAIPEPELFSGPSAIRNCVLLFLTGIITLVTDAFALGWVGMWQALVASGSEQARSRSIAYVFFVPWVPMLFLFSWVAVRQPNGVTAIHLLGAWFVIGMLNSIAFAIGARRQLRRNFRALAMERFQARPPALVWRLLGNRWATMLLRSRRRG